MLLYDIIEEKIDDSLKRESKEISTERGRMKKSYTGRIRILRNKITKKEIEEEEYYLLVERLSEIDYKFYWHKELKSSWERRKQKMKKSISSPVLRNTGEKLLMNIDNKLVEFFRESIETFGLEDVLEIREREAYNVDGDKIEDMSAVVITDIRRENEIDGTRLFRVADALQRERKKEIIEEIKTVASNYTFRFNENNQEIFNERVNNFIREISNERIRRDRNE